ncbi:tubby C-terminal-like domain-containing protein [Cercophora newfieldiana]|uniref:Tubby C-terminal-like domain-containing protein n=1 Tax=Cercophora newfieldiana TaxID=92897 RepID=A0AA40CV06_9PEZI|nr:tubby C-terminal-like domain-containing protein [Cercophora newfieldiana]
MAVQLAPVQHPLGIWNQFLARQTETLVLREKVMSLTGDSFDIKMANGQPIFKIQGKVMSISGRKSVYDMGGNHLFDIVKEHLHIHATYAAVDPSGRKLLEVKSSFALLGSKATATFTNASNHAQESLQMKGNWFDSAADIVDLKTGFVVGRIDRKLLSGRDLLFGQQTYALTVAPNVDLALMVAMCICMDEKNNEGKGGLLGF